MSRELTAQDFTALLPDNPMSGEEYVALMGFDPTQCKITVTEGGPLVIDQENPFRMNRLDYGEYTLKE